MVVRPLSRSEVRGIDASARELGLPTLVLMENAGRGAAQWLRERAAGGRGRVIVLCGPGNNGGDGGVVARHLDAWGFAVQVVWFAPADQIRGDAAVQHDVLAHAGIDQQTWPGAGEPEQLESLFAAADWLVDGLLGTGLTRPVAGLLLAVIEAANRSRKAILALDLPSGLDADSGQPLGAAIRASATATFVAPKIGFSAPGAAAYTGEVVVVEIGVPRSLLEPFREGPPPQ